MSDACCHNHSHEGVSLRTLVWAIVLNVVFIVGQVYYGVVAHSLSLLADAGHNFGDVLGLVLAAIAVWVARTRPTKAYTYGLKSATILATLANTVLLLLTVFEITHQAVERLITPPAVEMDTVTVMWVAAVAVLVNGFTAWTLHAGNEHDLNIRGMYLHLLADTAVSVGVIIGALAYRATGWVWLDPVISLGIALAILWAAWNLLRQTLRLALQGVPAHIQVPQVEVYLKSLPPVTQVHDLHIWALGTQQTALSAHLTCPAGHPGDAFLDATAMQLRKDFNITHATLQIELGTQKCGCQCGCE